MKKIKPKLESLKYLAPIIWKTINQLKMIIAALNLDLINFFDFWKCNWFHLDAPRHLNHFSPASLRVLLEKNGFGVEKIFCLPYTEESSPGSGRKWSYGLRKMAHPFLPSGLQEEIVVLARKRG